MLLMPRPYHSDLPAMPRAIQAIWLDGQTAGRAHSGTTLEGRGPGWHRRQTW